MLLKDLTDNPGARKRKVRVGRGIGSGKGKTCGRGVKGQKSRSGVAINGFEGGQMPLHMRIPKRGFTRPSAPRYVAINLDTLTKAIDAGKLDISSPITAEVLVSSGVIRRSRDGVRILGRGELTKAVTLEVAGASQSAVAAIEKAGGSIKVANPPKSEAGSDS